MNYLPLIILLAITSCASYMGPKKFDQSAKFNYAGDDSERHMCESFVPAGSGPFPGVVIVHGGGWDTRSYEDVRTIAKSLASHGIVALSINYRFPPHHQHPAPIEDLEVAVTFFKAHAQKFKLDQNRIGLWGYSSGAHTVAYYAITRNTQANLKVQAVVAGGGPYDFTWYPKSPIIGPYMGHFRDEALKEYFEASPSHLVKPGLPPFFLYHSKNDKLVEHAQSTSFQAQLKRSGGEAKRFDIPFWGHAFGFIMSDEAVKKGVLFLKKRL